MPAPDKSVAHRRFDRGAKTMSLRQAAAPAPALRTDRLRHVLQVGMSAEHKRTIQDSLEDNLRAAMEEARTVSALDAVLRGYVANGGDKEALAYLEGSAKLRALELQDDLEEKLMQAYRIFDARNEMEMMSEALREYLEQGGDPNSDTYTDVKEKLAIRQRIRWMLDNPVSPPPDDYDGSDESEEGE